MTEWGFMPLLRTYAGGRSGLIQAALTQKALLNMVRWTEPSLVFYSDQSKIASACHMMKSANHVIQLLFKSGGIIANMGRLTSASGAHITGNMHENWPNAGLMLGQRRRR